MSNAQQTHERMIREREIERCRQYITAADLLIREPAPDYSAQLIEQVRAARDSRQRQLDELLAQQTPERFRPYDVVIDTFERVAVVVADHTDELSGDVLVITQLSHARGIDEYGYRRSDLRLASDVDLANVDQPTFLALQHRSRELLAELSA